MSDPCLSTARSCLQLDSPPFDRLASLTSQLRKKSKRKAGGYPERLSGCSSHRIGCTRSSVSPRWLKVPKVGWHHKIVASKYIKYIASANAGDCKLIAHYLKLDCYYTGNEGIYATSMTSKKAERDRTLGPAV